MDVALQGILVKNGQTEIGVKWNFAKISTVEEFRQAVPLTAYDDYKPYIDRMVEKGEQKLITDDTISRFSVSSGTTGKAKYIPGVSKIPSLKDIMPPSGVKILHLINIPDEIAYTPFGMPVEAISVRVVRSLIEACPDNYVIPSEAYHISPLSVALYVQMVLALKEPQLNEISSVFIPTVISAVMLLKSRWREMLEDVRSGKIGSTLPLTSEKRSALEKCLSGPDPIRADVLQEILEQAETSNYESMLSKIWPQLRVIKCLCSGNMSCFVPTLKHYCGSNIHVSSYWYGCTEIDIIGIPVKPLEEVSLFRLAPNNFYEFIPIDKSSERKPNTLLSNEVEIGKAYEIVVTSSAGFYRYRIGDYIKIIDQREQGPLFDFHGREKMILKLGGHSLYEANFEKAMTIFTSTMTSRVDYIISIDDHLFSRYKVWIECADVERNGLDKYLDKCLQEVDFKYKVDRSNGRLDQLIVAMVKPGTFAKILTFMKSRTLNTEAQLKIPRMVLLSEIQEILEQNVTE